MFNARYIRIWEMSESELGSREFLNAIESDISKQSDSD